MYYVEVNAGVAILPSFDRLSILNRGSEIYFLQSSVYYFFLHSSSGGFRSLQINVGFIFTLIRRHMFYFCCIPFCFFNLTIILAPSSQLQSTQKPGVTKHTLRPSPPTSGTRACIFRGFRTFSLVDSRRNVHTHDISISKLIRFRQFVPFNNTKLCTVNRIFARSGTTSNSQTTGRSVCLRQ